MDVFKIGLRNILGLTMPGALLVLVFSYTLLRIVVMTGLDIRDYLWGKDQQFLMLAIFFSISFIIGALIRLKAADNVDKKSRKKLLKEYFSIFTDDSKFKEILKDTKEELNRKLFFKGGKVSKWKKTEKKLFSRTIIDSSQNRTKTGMLKARLRGLFHREIVSDKRKNDFQYAFDRWIWREESFPYPIWEFRKFRLFQEDDMFEFYYDLRKCMADARGIGEKEFFNYCKIAVVHGGKSHGANLKDEIHNEEATVRFFAGVFFALKYSLFLLVGLLLFQGYIWIFCAKQDPQSIFSGTPLESTILHFFVTLFLIVTFGLLKLPIIRRFRTLRLREVDAVYNAYYLINRKKRNT